MAQKATDVQCPRLNTFLEDIDMDTICTDLLWRTLATCMWNGHRVMIMTPWKQRILTFDEVERALFDMSLRLGVRRSHVLGGAYTGVYSSPPRSM
jgi:hypothetical protein